MGGWEREGDYDAYDSLEGKGGVWSPGGVL